MQTNLILNRGVSRYQYEKNNILFQVPKSFSFIACFDLLFKIFQVTNFAYDDNLKSFMNFVQCFLYQIPSKNFKPTQTMIEIFNELDTNENDTDEDDEDNEEAMEE